MDAGTFRSEFGRHVSDAALKRGLHRPHKVIFFHDLFSAVESHRQQTSRMAKKLNLQESWVVICCLYSLTACRPVEF